MRVIQPEIRADGQVYRKKDIALSNPKFVVETPHGDLVALIGNSRVAAPLFIKGSILTRDQMEEVMLRVAQALAALDEWP